MIKKELGVYRRVPGSSDQKTDLFAFGEHPTYDTYYRFYSPYYMVYIVSVNPLSAHASS